MKTKFILHGGYADRLNEHNDNFFKEILKDVPEEISVLLVYFAKDKEGHGERVKKNKSLFNKNSGNKKLSFEVASENTFLEQVSKADVIYLHGGKTIKLLNALKKFPEFQEKIKGKIIAGESAGAYVLSSCFYSKSEDGVFKGLELVPVKTICHYTGVNEDKLDECPLQLEKLLLADYLYKVFQK